MTAVLSRIQFADGAERRFRLDSAQRQGHACICCAHVEDKKGDKTMRPVGRIQGGAPVVAHPTCAKRRRHMETAR